MKTAFAVLPFVCLLNLKACSSTRNLSDVRPTHGFRQLGNGTILLGTGREYFGERIVVREDSTSWDTMGPGRWLSVPNTEILSVTVTSREGGALRGIRNGVLIGAVSVLALAAMTGTLQPQPDGVGVVMPVMFGGFAGFWIGAGVGLTIGHTTVTQFR